MAEFVTLYENRITKKEDVGNNFKCAFYGRFGGGTLHRMHLPDDSQLAKARLVYPAMEAVDSENKYQPPHPPRLGPSKIASEEGSLSDNLWGIFENSLAGRKVEVDRIDFEQRLGLAAYIKLRKLFDPHCPLWDKNKSGSYNTLSER